MNELQGLYSGPGGAVELDVVSYGRRVQDAELIGSLNALIETKRWQIVETRRVGIDSVTGDPWIRETVVRGATGQRVLWQWYLIGGIPTSVDWQAKLLEAWGVLTRSRSGAKLVVLSTPSADADTGRETLRGFLDGSYTEIERCLQAESAPRCSVVPL